MERLIRFFAALTRWGLGLCALLLVLAAVYVSLGRELTPLVAEYRAEVEAKAQAAVDMPLHIGSLEGRWSGFAPVLLAHDVMVGEGSSALRLDQVEVVPDMWASLMAREVRIAHLQVSGLQLSVKEDKDGKWALQGLPVQNDQPVDPEQLLKNMQKVKRVSLLDSQVTLQPFDQAPVTLTYVGLSLHTGITRQRLDARLTLPDGQPLAVSLYRHLIMDETWATQRAEYGYRDVRPSPLLISFAGHPYVDIRASFNSFIPKALDEQLATRLADFYLGWLEQHPYLHDKVEFDVVPTCFALDFDRWQERLSSNGFSQSEIDQLRDGLREISANAMLRNHADLADIAKLEQRFEQLRTRPMPPLEKVWALLYDCRKYGTLPFAHLARSAFVAVTLLRSAVSTGVLSEAEMDDFLNSIRTVSHMLTHDAESCAHGDLSWDAFVEKYGHLRPGTYDINSLSYRADPERYLKPIIDSVTAPHATQVTTSGELWKQARPRFVAALAEQGLKHDGDTLEHFLKEAIEGREYSKFVFTRNLSLALDELVTWAEPLDVSREDLACLEIDTLLALRNDTSDTSVLGEKLRELARANEAKQQQTQTVELPPLLCTREDLSVFLYPATQPNFVGTGQVRAACVDLSEDKSEQDLAGKIALIPQADPGYDWLFGRQIAGLITMYGGANSHMAIRAAEFGLPAALGVGETQYRALASAKVLDLNAGNRVIRVIR